MNHPKALAAALALLLTLAAPALAQDSTPSAPPPNGPATAAPAPTATQAAVTSQAATQAQAGDTPADGDAAYFANKDLVKADKLLANGNATQAESLYQTILQRDYKNLYAHDGLARARYQAGDLPGAATALEVAASIYPKNFQLQYNLGLVWHQLKQDTKAAKAFEAAVKIGGDTPRKLADANMGLGLADLSLGKLDKAVTALTEAQKLDPSPDREYLLLVARYRNGERVELLPDALKAAQASKDYRFDLLAARVYRDIGDGASATAHLTTATAHAKTKAQKAAVLFRRATIAMSDGGDAQTLLQKAQTLAPAMWQISYDLGLVALQRADSATALAQLTTAAHQSNNDPSVLAVLARAELNAGRYQDALTHAKSAIAKQDHASPDLNLTAADAAYHLGQYATAQHYLPSGKGLKQQPYDVVVLAGEVAYHLKQYEQAANDLDTAYSLKGSDALKRDLATAQLAAAQYQAAATTLQDLTESHPNDGVLQQQLGWAQHKLGNTVQAQLAFRRANALGVTLDSNLTIP